MKNGEFRRQKAKGKRQKAEGSRQQAAGSCQWGFVAQPIDNCYRV
ncbi:hypothetical protein [Moorena producens]